MSEPPVLGKPVQLAATFTISGKIDAPNTEVELLLPEGLELVSGTLKSTVNVGLDSPTQFQATVKSVKTGDWSIQVRAYYYYPIFVGNVGVAQANLYVRVSEDSAQVSDTPLPLKEVPRPTRAEPPPEPPSKLPAEPGDIAPRPNPSPAAFSPPGEGALLSNPLVITGGFSCRISENSVPQSPNSRDDEVKPMVWGGVYVFNATTYEFIDSTWTGPVYVPPGEDWGDDPGEFSITIENLGSDGFYVEIRPRMGRW